MFCEVVAGREPARIVARWPEALAFQPLNPVTVGHTLVIPRAHVVDAIADPEAAGATMRCAAEFAGWQGADGYNLITSIGAAATQTVFHLHVHVVPRWPTDKLLLPWSPQPEGPHGWPPRPAAGPAAPRGQGNTPGTAQGR